jgi:hypothetical protein
MPHRKPFTFSKHHKSFQQGTGICVAISQIVPEFQKANVQMKGMEAAGFTNWYSRPELNWDQRFRKPLLYPFELRERARSEL